MQWQYVSRAIYGNAMRSATGIIINRCNILLQCSLAAIYWTSAMCNWWLVWGQDFIIEHGQSLCAICRWTAPGYTSCICMCICVYLYLLFYILGFDDPGLPCAIGVVSALVRGDAKLSNEHRPGASRWAPTLLARRTILGHWGSKALNRIFSGHSI